MALPHYINPRFDWNNTGEGSYWFHKPQGGFEERPIPNHPKLREIYELAFDYALDNSWNGGTIAECCSKIEEKFGQIDQAMRDYIAYGPYDAGDRAAMLREDPNHYE